MLCRFSRQKAANLLGRDKEESLASQGKQALRIDSQSRKSDPRRLAKQFWEC